MKVGAYLPVSFPDGVPEAREVSDYAVEAEQLGFDSLWSGDHLLWRVPMAEPLTTLAFVAAATSRLALGINVYLAALRPAVISARLLGNLWWLTGRRLVLGVGVGGDYPREFAAAGVPLAQRGRRLDRTLGELREWWGRDGDDGVALRPDRHVPLWIGGRSDAALARVVRERADGFSAHMVTADQLGRVKLRLGELCEEAGAPLPQIAVTVMINVTDTRGTDAGPFLRAHFGEVSDRLERFVVRGTGASCAEQIAAYAAVADHLIFMPASFDARRQLARIREATTNLENA